MARASSTRTRAFSASTSRHGTSAPRDSTPGLAHSGWAGIGSSRGGGGSKNSIAALCRDGSEPRDARLLEVLRDPAEEERVAGAEDQAGVDVGRRVDDAFVEH